MQKRIFLIAIALCYALVLGAKDFVGNLEDYPFIIITKDTTQTLPSFTDKEFYSISTGVIFKVNRTEIRRDDPFFELYRNVIVPVINSSHLQLRKLYIRGAASPEGSYANNQRLGRGRTQALLAELQDELNHQYLQPEIDLSSVTEDYGYLCILMEEAGDPDYAEVKEIYDGCNGDEQTCKKLLSKAQGGRLWARLLKEYFPRLRSARVILWFSEPDIEHSPLVANIQPLHTVASLPDHYFIPQVDIPVFEAPVPSSRRHLLAVRTNLLRDGFYLPQFGWAPSLDVQLEYYPVLGHYTYNASFTWSNHRHWSSQEFFQMRDAQLELRRYFVGGGKFLGTYLGAYLEGNVYGIGLSRTKGWEGEGGGAGLSAGYVMPLTRKGNLRLEFMASLGFYTSLHDPYVYGNPITGTIDGDYYYNFYGNAEMFKRRNHIFTWFGPTNFGINLTYDILYRKKQYVQKGGAL